MVRAFRALVPFLALSLSIGCVSGAQQAFSPEELGMTVDEHSTGWASVTAADGRYRISMPGIPVVIGEARTTQRGRMIQTKLDFRESSDSRAWIVYVFDRSKKAMKPTALELRYQQKALALSFEGEVREAHEGVVRGHPAREVVVHQFANGKLVAIGRIVVQDARVFWLIAVLPADQEAKLAGSVARFFDSLEMFEPTPKPG